jgi:hypothetical protein
MVFTNREIATIIWGIVVFIVLVSFKSVSKAIYKLLRSVFNTQLILIFLCAVAYISAILYVLDKLSIWEIGLLKSTLFWFFGVAIPLIFSFDASRKKDYFSKIIHKSLKWTLLVEFIVNFYSFRLWIELLLLPCIFFVSLMTIDLKDPKLVTIQNFFRTLLGLIGILLISISLYRTIKQYRLLFTEENLKELLLAPIMSLLLLPFIYLLAVKSGYQQLFLRYFFSQVNNPKITWEQKKLLWGSYGLNLKKINKALEPLVFADDDID